MRFFVRASGEPDGLVKVGLMLGWKQSGLDEADIVLTDDLDQCGIAVAAGKSALVLSGLAIGGAAGNRCNTVARFGQGCIYGTVPQ
jgi:hypothetical protein